MPAGGPALPPEQGAALIIAGLSTREYGGHVVALCGEPDVVNAAGIMAALAVVFGRQLLGGSRQ